MKKPLVNQSGWQPTRKVVATSFGAAVAGLVNAMLESYVPGAVPEPVRIALVPVIAGAFGWFTRDRSQ